MKKILLQCISMNVNQQDLQIVSLGNISFCSAARLHVPPTCSSSSPYKSTNFSTNFLIIWSYFLDPWRSKFMRDWSINKLAKITFPWTTNYLFCSVWKSITTIACNSRSKPLLYPNTPQYRLFVSISTNATSKWFISLQSLKTIICNMFCSCNLLFISSFIEQSVYQMFVCNPIFVF